MSANNVFKGDYNITRKQGLVRLGIISVVGKDGKPIAIFLDDEVGKKAYGHFVSGFASSGTGTLYNLDTEQFDIAYI